MFNKNNYPMEQEYISEPELQQPMNTEATGTFKQGYQDSVDPNLVMYQLSQDPELLMIVHQLRTMSAGTSLIKNIIIILRSCVNRNVFLSNYDDEAVRKACTAAEYAVNDTLFEYGDNLKISDKGSVLNACTNYIEASYKRPFMQGERSFLAKTVETKHIMQQKPREKSSFLGQIFKGGSK